MSGLFSKRWPLLSAAALLSMTASSAHALVINNYFSDSVKNNPRHEEIIAAINYSSRAFEALFSNDVAVNIQYVLDGSVGVGLGRAASDSERYSKDLYVQMLTENSLANPQNKVPAEALNNLGQSNYASPDVEYIQANSALLRAIGIPYQGSLETWGPPDDPWYPESQLPEGQGLDGSIMLMSISQMLFDTDIPESEMPKYDKDKPNSLVFAAINTIQHEIMHVLGGGNSIVQPGEDQITSLDLYRYTAPGKPSDGNDNDTAYFSIDGGKTNIQWFNTGNHWEPGGWGPMAPCPTGYGNGGPIGLFMDAASCGNQPTVTLSLDSPEGIQLMALGWNPRVAAVPEPATWTMMLVGFGGVAAALRRRRSKVAVRVGFA